METLIWLPVVIVLGTIAASAATGLWAYRVGWWAGYRAARTLPIGTLKGLSIGKLGADLTAVLDEDVVIEDDIDGVPVYWGHR